MKKIHLILLILILVLAGCSNHNENSFNQSDSFLVNCCEHLNEMESGIYMDYDHISDGYIAIKIENEGKYVVQINYDDIKYNFFVPDNEVHFFTLVLGEGNYSIRVLKNTKQQRYGEVCKYVCDVTFTSEFQPFLRSNFICDYSIDSECVLKAQQLANKAANESEFLTSVYQFVCQRLSYDTELSMTVTDGYVPNPDIAYQRKKGICYDYSSLACAMLRSQGIPCKIVTGYFGEDKIYHAWNMVYLSSKGWVAYEYNLLANSWGRVDMTLADAKEVNYNQQTYTECYIY